MINIMYEMPTFSSVWPFFEEGGRGSRKFRPEAEIFGTFSIEVAPKNVESILNWFSQHDLFIALDLI